MCFEKICSNFQSHNIESVSEHLQNFWLISKQKYLIRNALNPLLIFSDMCEPCGCCSSQICDPCCNDPSIPPAIPPSICGTGCDPCCSPCNTPTKCFSSQPCCSSGCSAPTCPPNCFSSSCGPSPCGLSCACSPCNPSCCGCPTPCARLSSGSIYRCAKREFDSRVLTTQCGYMKKNGLQFSCPVSDCAPRPCAFTMPHPGCPPVRAVPPVMRMKY